MSSLTQGLVAGTSHIIVQDAAGHEVDKRDTRVSISDPREMTVTLARLSAVLWVAQSADDEHITEGSFIFSVTLPDGTIPPLPTGASPGGGTSTSNSAILDGPTIVQTLATWLALHDVLAGRFDLGDVGPLARYVA